jgi:hypothetical protein
MKKNITRIIAMTLLCCALLVPTSNAFATEDPPIFDSIIIVTTNK